MKDPNKIIRAALVPALMLASVGQVACGGNKRPVKAVQEFKMGAPAPGAGFRTTESYSIVPDNCQIFEVVGLKPGHKANLLTHKIMGREDALSYADGTHPLLVDDQIVVKNRGDGQPPAHASTLEVYSRTPFSSPHYASIANAGAKPFNLGEGLSAVIDAAKFGTDPRVLSVIGQVCMNK